MTSGRPAPANASAGSKRRPRPDDLAARIAHDIRTGLYGPEGWMKQIDLERRYHATRLEVRRALDRLVDKRVVRHLANRGYHVAPPEERRLAEHREVRMILECAAADSVVANADDAMTGELRRLALRFRELASQGTLVQQYQANIAFHARMLSRCDNRELVALISEMRECDPAVPAAQWAVRADLDKSAAEHLEMVDAIAARDVAWLKRAIAAHIRQARRSSRS